MMPTNNPTEEIKALRKAGNLRAAYDLAKMHLEENPDDPRIANAFGWVLFSLAQNARQRAKAEPALRTRCKEQLKNTLKLYYELKLPLPDLLHSLLVGQVVHFEGAEDVLYDLVKWGGRDAFRREDYMPQPASDGKSYKPLVEQVTSTIAKAALDLDDPTRKQFALDMIDETLNNVRVERPEHFHYRKGQLLAELGRPDEAQAILLPFVRRKQQEYWAWEALGKVAEANEPRLALALYAMASRTCPDEDFRVGVNENLARSAADQGNYPLARWAVDHTVKHREQRGWRLTQGLETLRAAPWYLQTQAEIDPESVLARLSEDAKAVLYADALWVKGSFLQTFEPKPGRVNAVFAVQRHGKSASVVASTKLIDMPDDLEPGDPIQAQVIHDDEITIHSVKRRSDGTLYDCLDAITGVIDHHNADKSLTSVYVPEDRFVLLHHKDYPAAKDLAPGSGVRVWVCEDKRGFRGYRFEPAEVEDSAWIQRFTGVVNVHDQGFGFLDEVFVPPPLAQQCDDYEVVQVLAVRKRNKKRMQLGWTAVSISAGHD
jgi:tetratricopeptide (TPR) repeat protein